MVSALWENNPAQGLWQLSFPLSHPRATNHSLSLHNLSTPASLQLEPRLSDHSKILCIGPLRGHLCLQQTLISPWGAESLLIFRARCYLGTPSQLWFSVLGSPAWSWDPMFPQGEHLQLKYPSRISAAIFGNGARFGGFSGWGWSYLPISCNVVSSVIPWLYDFCSTGPPLVMQVDWSVF